MAVFSSYLTNRLVDQLVRGQAYTFPSTLYVGLFTTTPTANTAGTEVSGGSYARVGVAASLTAWAGTQGAGTTVASTGTGTSGTTSNNGAITFPAPTANWGIITGWATFDASTAGNMLLFGSLSTSKTVNNGDAAPSFAAAALQVTLS